MFIEFKTDEQNIVRNPLKRLNELKCCLVIYRELNFSAVIREMVGMFGGMKLRAVSFFKMAHNVIRLYAVPNKFAITLN